ncbi:polyprenyl synthetase family protein [Streptomyces sp. NRRL S-813]|uniref:polyprenyl synthetase family protein n=1 Tax=Streptomyces sp. NRRL S-813 TaxID=1463919 RepID=UPI00055AB4F3|nr:polyprenyl synthetase family protein [Streptomyces sp. NRRL S-813]
MAGTAWDTDIPTLISVRDDVDAVLKDFVGAQERTALGPETAPLFTTVRRLLFSKGKRLRSLLCVAGWQAAGASGDSHAVLHVAAAMELFQTFALIHDDVMDDSDARRGRPSAHRALASEYMSGGGRHNRAEAHGRGAAILLGDLLLVWSDEMLAGAGLGAPARSRVLPLVASMRAELVYGQYLDLLSTGRMCRDVEAGLRVARYKTGKYTVERPLHIGVSLADGDPRLLQTCTDFAIPLGEAFQLRDDLLDVFGDPAQTGKPVGDDIREGKATVLLALAVQNASVAELQLLRTLIGSPELGRAEIDRVRTVLETTGARHRVEEMISARRDAALATLDEANLPREVAEMLRQIVWMATERQS